MKLQKMLEDLRFIISFLFGIFAIILLVLGVFGEPPAPGRLNLNLYAGLLMAVFSTCMGYLGYSNLTRKDVSPRR